MNQIDKLEVQIRLLENLKNSLDELRDKEPNFQRSLGIAQARTMIDELRKYAGIKKMKLEQDSECLELFNKQYDGESIVDIERDLMEMFNDVSESVPVDENNIMNGTFTVQVSWEQENG